MPEASIGFMTGLTVSYGQKRAKARNGAFLYRVSVGIDRILQVNPTLIMRVARPSWTLETNRGSRLTGDVGLWR